MAIIVKYILKSIAEKKFRTFLILFSVTLSVALFFASVALSGTVQQLFMERMKQFFGNAQILIYPNEKSPTPFYSTKPAERFRSEYRSLAGTVESGAVYKFGLESVNFNVKGYRLQELQQINPYLLQAQRGLHPFIGKKLIISKATAEKYHLQPGNKINLLIDQTKYRFQIAGIAQNYGLFQEDGRSVTAVAPRETLAGLLNATGKVSLIMIQLNDPNQVGTMIAKLKTVYPHYTVAESVPKEELAQYISMISNPLLIMLNFVLFMSVFIIYTSFKVITRERLPVIGTFRSIGATKRLTDLVLLAESLFYGISGGLAGCGLGLAFLYAITVMMRPQWLKAVPVALEYSPVQLLGALLLGVVLALASSCLPIVALSRIPVKEIVLNAIQHRSQPPRRRLAMGLTALALALSLPLVAPQSAAFFLNIAAMVLAVTAVIFLVPFLTAGFTFLFERLLYYLVGNEGVLAAKNLRENQAILNNISLLAIGISSLLLINTLSFTVGKEVLNAWRDFHYDVWLFMPGDRSQEGLVRSTHGVQGVYGLYSEQNIELVGQAAKITWLHGANQRQYADYFSFNLAGNTKATLDQLDRERNILLTRTLKEKLGVALGDVVTLRTKRGNKPYRIIGFFESLVDNGSFAIISERYFKLDMARSTYDSLLIKTSGAPKQVVEALQKKFNQQRPYLETIRDLEQRNLNANQQILLVLQAFSVLAMVIGVFGVFNNLIISFLERRRALAVLRSVGMSQRQMIKMIFLEALSCGAIGGVVGILTGLLLLSLVGKVLQAMNLSLTLHYDPAQFGYALVAGMVIMLVASVSPGLRSQKLNIMEALKYE